MQSLPGVSQKVYERPIVMEKNHYKGIKTTSSSYWRQLVYFSGQFYLPWKASSITSVNIYVSVLAAHWASGGHCICATFSASGWPTSHWHFRNKRRRSQLSAPQHRPWPSSRTVMWPAGADSVSTYHPSGCRGILKRFSETLRQLIVEK